MNEDEIINQTSTEEEASASKEMTTEELFDAMKTRKRELYAILEYCLTPQEATAVNSYVDELQKEDRSVYSGAILCNMLERCHALEKVNEDGAAFSEEKVEPEEVESEDGDYYVCGEEIKVYWLTTEEGKSTLEAWNPVAEALAIATKNPDHTHVYLKVLQLCSEENGKTINQLSEVIDDDPALQKPRFFAAHFTDALETAQALLWNKTWKTTEVGKEVMEQLQQQLQA